MACSLFVARQDKVEILGLVDRIENWENRATRVANYKIIKVSTIVRKWGERIDKYV
jgi:hypothetical protein